jgi:hypothetical protein
MKVTAPGIYYDVAEADYRSDPTPIPSLTQSLVKIIVEKSPKHAWCASPRLNPQYEYEDDTKFDLGNITHRLILGRGKDIEVVQFDDWRKKAAQDAREEAAEHGRIAVLQHQFDQATEMVTAAWAQLKVHEDSDAFQGGRSEVMICWEEDGIWFRSLIDHISDDLRTITDFKTSGMSMAPHIIGIRAETAGWHIQAAFIERGLDILDPAGAGRRRFRFIAEETDKPHTLTSMHMNEYWLSMGRKKVQAGIALWRPAVATNYWRGYGTAAVVPEYPGYKEKQWLERELAGDFEPQNDPKMIMAG